MELLLILVVAGGLIWLLASGSKGKRSKQPDTHRSDDRQDPPIKD